MFDNKRFDATGLLRTLSVASPKLDALIKKIESLDDQDKRESGQVYKHFIFSDVKARGYGAKIIASALIAKGWRLAYDDKLNVYDDATLRQTPGNNLALLSSTSTFGQPSPASLKKKLLTLYNKRPENTNGDLARIIILDSGFKEGIDLFDVKYVHVFEPPLSMADQKQVIGRATRTCGQKGLRFDPQQGWPLHVFLYDIKLPEIIQDRKYPIETMNELYMSLSGIDLRLNNMAFELEKHVISAAIDKSLNKSVHDFKITTPKDGGGPQDTLPQASPPQSSPSQLIETITPEQPLKVTATRKQRSDTPKWVEQRSKITKQLGRFKWPPARLENGCEPKMTNASSQTPNNNNLLKFNPSQEFTRHYFTPKTPVNGILLNFSTGVGKTCAAIATASSAFEADNYTIVWVTRTTLKSDLYKNMFDQSCNVPLREKLTTGVIPKLPQDSTARKRLLSRAWRIPPLSYKQFTNLLAGKNEFYQKLVDANGKEDPLRKTLLIIDEAHKLFNAEDLSSIERPDTNMLHRMLHNSYAKSGKDAVKVMLMTATPITSNPMDFMRLMNLILPTNQQLPTTFDDMLAAYLAPNGNFTRPGAARLKATIANHVLYLDRSRDAREFAQPRIHNIHTHMSSRQHSEKLNTRAELKQRIALRHKTDVVGLQDAIKTLTAQLKTAKAASKQQKKQKAANSKQLKALQKEIKETQSALKKAQHPKKGDPQQVANLEAKLRELNNRHATQAAAQPSPQAQPTQPQDTQEQALKKKVEGLKVRLAQAKRNFAAEKKRIEALVTQDMSQERMMKERCNLA